MPRLINEPITVHLNADSVIHAFIWRRRLYKVLAVLSCWREPSTWWDGEPIKKAMRVTAANCSIGIYELYQTEGEWFLHSLLD